MRSTFILAFGIFVGADGSLGYSQNKHYGLRIWIAPSKIPKFNGAYHIFIHQQNDPSTETECEYESIHALNQNWKGLDLSVKCQLDFGSALIAMQIGKKIARIGWNGKGMWASFSPGRTLPETAFWNEHTAKFAKDNGGEAYVGAYCNLLTPDRVIEMGWRPTPRDMFAQDWQILD